MYSVTLNPFTYLDNTATPKGPFLRSPVDDQFSKWALGYVRFPFGWLSAPRSATFALQILMKALRSGYCYGLKLAEDVGV